MKTLNTADKLQIMYLEVENINKRSGDVFPDWNAKSNTRVMSLKTEMHQGTCG